jgi:hypothetical protein
MGSSLTVTPAAHIPRDVAKKGRLVIVNLQTTPLDKYAYLRINGMCDDVMKRLTAKLNLKIRPFTLNRLINFTPVEEGVSFRGVDSRGVPFTFFKSVSVKLDKGKAEPLKGEPYLLKLNKCK